MYGLFIREFYRYIENDVGVVREGSLRQNYMLYTESCSLLGSGCEDGRDRYGLCSNIVAKGKRIIKTRYADFPWTVKRESPFPIRRLCEGSQSNSSRTSASLTAS